MRKIFSFAVTAMLLAASLAAEARGLHVFIQLPQPVLVITLPPVIYVPVGPPIIYYDPVYSSCNQYCVNERIQEENAAKAREVQRGYEAYNRSLQDPLQRRRH